jgi:hypothetical protein
MVMVVEIKFASIKINQNAEENKIYEYPDLSKLRKTSPQNLSPS